MTFGLVLLTVGLQTSGAGSAASTVKPAVPVEPVAAILDAFKTHNVVAIDEGAHGNEQGHAFRLTLIRDPRFPTLVNDIVVESGNARYQETVDRFIRGEDVPLAQLRRAWQDTTQHAVWDAPIFEEFFRAVRAVTRRYRRPVSCACSLAIHRSIGTRCARRRITSNGSVYAIATRRR